MSYALVASITGKIPDSGWTANGGTTGAIDTTGATLLIVGVSSYNSGGTTVTVSDSKSNTWHPLTLQQWSLGGGTFLEVQLFYSYATSVGSGHTFTIGRNTGNLTALVLTFSGSSGDVFDAENGTVDNGPVTSVQPGSITPAKNNELFITLLYQGTSTTIDSGFTIDFQVDGNGSTVQYASIAHKIKTNAAAENPTWSWTGAGSGIVTMAAFKLNLLPSGGGAGKGMGHGKGGGGVTTQFPLGANVLNIGNPGLIIGST